MKTPWVFSRCELRSVTDGDSVKIMVDTGFNHSAKIKVRLLGVDCPEKNKDPEGWRISREFTLNWFAEAKSITLECYGPDKYGDRWSGKIYNALGEYLSEAILTSHMGVPYNGGKKVMGP